MSSASTTTTKTRTTRKRTSVPNAAAGTMSKAAAAALLGDGEAVPGSEPDRILHLDPHTLTLDENARKDIGMTAEFAADVAEKGVTVPLLAYRDAIGQLLVWDGQRRLIAALEAGNAANATVPVVLTQAFGDGEERLATQDRVNHHRAGLTTVDQVKVYEQLSLISRSAQTIAKKLRRPPSEVEAALTVAKSKAATKAAEQAPNLTLDQLAALAEFDDDPDIQKELRDDALNHPASFSHSLQRRRDDRARAQVLAAARAEVEAAGVPIIDVSWWSVRGGAEVSDLLDKPGGKQLTNKGHSSCPGHAAHVSVSRSYGPNGRAGDFKASVIYGCTAWVKNGHTHKHKSATAAAKAQDLPPDQAEALKAERRAVRENNKASESATLVRRRFVIDLLQRKTLPDDAPQAAAEILRGKPDADYAARGITEVLLGAKTVPAAAQLGKSKRDALAYLLAETFARVEGYMAGTSKDWWRSQDATRIAYLKRLQSWGYPLSALEAAYVGNKISGLTL